MTILANDIKIRASKVMADVPEGGGGPSAKVIEWGQSNTMFDDVDTVSRTLGNVSIRQAFLHVDTANTDRLLGSYAMVAKLPEDPNVAVTLAASGPFARRSEISEAIANYLIRGVPWNGLLMGNHVQGQASMQIMQRLGTAKPTVGRTLVLVQNEGLQNEKVEWVRVIKVESETRTFTDEQGDYQAQVVRCDLASGLTQDLTGTDPNRFFTKLQAAALLRDTTTADASNYYGAAALAESAALNSLKVKTTGVYGQLVPSSATQVPALDQRPAAQRVLVLAESPRRVEVPATPHTRRTFISQENRGLSYVFSLSPLPEPGTIVITWVGLGNRQTVEDTGSGTLQGAGAGTVNYLTGSIAITLPSLPDAGSAIVCQWGERLSFTSRADQGANIRAPEYAFQLEGDEDEEGLVERLSLELSYTSNNTVYTVTDDGDGVLTGDGTGRIDYYNRTVFFKPSHMPDAASQFSIDYTLEPQVTDTFAMNGLTPDEGGFVQLTLSQTPAAGTVGVMWAVARNVSAASGTTVQTLSSSKTSQVNNVQRGRQTGMTKTPASYTGVGGSLYLGVYQYDPVMTYETVSYGHGASDASSFSEQTAITDDDRVVAIKSVTDDGAGNLYGTLGTVDYVGKKVTVKVIDFNRSASAYKSDYEDASEFSATTLGGSASSGTDVRRGGSYDTAAVGEEKLAGSTVVAIYRTGTGDTSAKTMSWTPPGVAIDLARYTAERIVPGSVRFTWMGTMYEDREGTLYRGTGGGGAGTASGRIDYMSGIAFMTDYVVGGSGPGQFTLQSLWTQKGEWQTASLFFMTEASPIQPGQITITCLDTAGNPIEVTSDLNGDLTGTHAIGKIEFQTGLVQLQFGDYVLDSGLTSAQKAEWWYDAGDVGAVEAGKIWKPWPVDPTSLRYNSVSNLYLPVDPEILGLNPTRLPQDGRVPIFAKGRMVCIGHNDTLAPATYADNDVIDLGRERVSHVWLIDANGELINEGFSATEAELDAGEITVTDRSQWVQPVTVEHRIQDMRLCTDVQIDGTLSFNFPLSHNFPAGSVASSVLLFGTIFARVANIFDQQTWDGITWADAPVGNVASASYNDAAYPIAVTNAGALNERYALRFRNDATAFDLIGEFSGGLGAGTKGADFEPNNPFNNIVKLFQLASDGWGAGWAAGNTLFLKLVGAMPAFACIRTVQPSQAAGTDYSFDLLAGGDVDRPPNDA